MTGYALCIFYLDEIVYEATVPIIGHVPVVGQFYADLVCSETKY